METRWVLVLTLASFLWLQTNADQEEADVAIALHVAKNVKISNIKGYLHSFLSDLVKATDVGSGAVRYSITVFGPNSEVQFDFNKFKTEAKLLKAIKRLKPKIIRKPVPDSLKLFETLTSSVYTAANGDRPGAPNTLIYITDQKSTGNAQAIEDKANELKASGTQIFTIGLRKAAKKELQGIASDPVDDNSYYLAAYKDLENVDLKNKLGESIYAFRNLRITTEPPPTTTSTTTTEMPTTTTTTTTTTKTTTKPTTTTTSDSIVWPLSGSEEADIVIALHLSPSTTEFEFMMAMNYLRNLIAGVAVEDGRVQIGLVYYNADPDVIFHINQYNSMEDIENVIDSISPDKRSFLVDASGAIALSRQMLSRYFNRREYVPAALIFITDAASTDNAELVASERDLAEQEGINIYSIGINLRDKSELEMLATAPDNVMTVSRVQELDTTIDEIKQKIFAFKTRVVETDKPGDPEGVITVPMPTDEPPIRITLPGSKVGKKLPDETFIGDERNRFRGGKSVLQLKKSNTLGGIVTA